MPYVARKRFFGLGRQVEIGDEVDLTGFPRPESMVRAGLVVWKGDGPRDSLAGVKAPKPVRGAHAVLVTEPPASKAAPQDGLPKPPAKKTAKKAPAKKVAP